MKEKKDEWEVFLNQVREMADGISLLIKGESLEVEYEFSEGRRKATFCIRGSNKVGRKKDIRSGIAVRNDEENKKTSFAINTGLKELTTTSLGLFTSFVKVGYRVKEGQKIGVMKVSGLEDHKILSEYNGEVIDICLGDGSFAEYKCILFRIKETRVNENKGG